MTVATVSADRAPSARILLLKDVDARGFTFYTNYGSRKARDLEANPRVALLFFWESIEQQVRVEGHVERVSRDESAAYFAMRPRAAQIGAWASHQSDVLTTRETLEQRVAELTAKFEGVSVPLPDFWGGYRVKPAAIGSPALAAQITEMPPSGNQLELKVGRKFDFQEGIDGDEWIVGGVHDQARVSDRLDSRLRARLGVVIVGRREPRPLGRVTIIEFEE